MGTKSDDDDDSINHSEDNDPSNESEGEESNYLSSDDSDESITSKYMREELERFKEKADNGDVDAMVKVANIYSLYQVYDEALRYYEMAASHGNLEALARQALYYFNGWGVSQDVNKGLQYYKQAADRGSEDAMVDLARIYVTGRHGVTRDYDKVRQIYEKRADAGHKDAQYILALFYQGRDRDGDKIPGAKVDESKAFELFQKSAEQNDEDSMYELGRCYRDGKGTSRDPVKAKVWFLKAIAKDHRESLFGLAMTVVDESLTDAEKQVIENLMEAEFFVVCDVRNEWFQWYTNEKDKPVDQQESNNTLLLDDLGLANATFLLARLLASTLDQHNLQIANKLISNVKDQLDTHDLLAWLSVLVEDLCKENEELSHIKQSTDFTFDVQKELRPIALIGQGQFGKVYLAWYSPDYESKRDPSRYVAIKFVDINLAYKDKVLARNVVREQLASRAVMAKEVKNTVKYLGYADLLSDRKRGLVFELCADLSAVEQLAEDARKNISTGDPVKLERLHNWIGKVPSSFRSCVVFPKGISKWTTVQVITMLRQAAEALLEVHKIGFIHRDIAPRNILCDGEGNIQLADFGWAKFVGCSSRNDATQLANYGKACFSSGHAYALAWWAPECFGSEEEDIDAVFSWNSDVYAFGTTMWMCFSHKDPFSHVSDPEQIKKMILEGIRPSLVKKPDAGGVLDRNTPDALIALIDSCWKQKATERVTLAGVIEVLGTIETNLQECASPHMGQKSYKKDVSQYWYDAGTHKILKRDVQIQTTPSGGELYGGEYSEVQEIQRLQKVCHEGKTIDKLLSHVKNSLEEYPYDIFLVHAGEQKMAPVETMKKFFEDGGLRCFLDRDMSIGRDPTWLMRFALATCRYAVVVLSSEFFTKEHPASELMYALKRMKWIRKQNNLKNWDSLIVVLYNVTVKEYESLNRADGIVLPDSLCSDVVLVEWSNLGKIPWYVQCLQLKADIIEKDKKDNALDKWAQYLKLYVSQELPRDLQLADELYCRDAS